MWPSQSSHVLGIKCSTLHVDGQPLMVTMDYRMDVASLSLQYGRTLMPERLVCICRLCSHFPSIWLTVQHLFFSASQLNLACLYTRGWSLGWGGTEDGGSVWAIFLSCALYGFVYSVRVFVFMQD